MIAWCMQQPFLPPTRFLGTDQSFATRKLNRSSRGSGGNARWCVAPTRGGNCHQCLRPWWKVPLSPWSTSYWMALSIKTALDPLGWAQPVALSWPWQGYADPAPPIFTKNLRSSFSSRVIKLGAFCCIPLLVRDKEANLHRPCPVGASACYVEAWCRKPAPHLSQGPSPVLLFGEADISFLELRMAVNLFCLWL